MRIITRKMLRDFSALYPDSKDALDSWYAEAKHASWSNPADVKAQYRSASILKEGRVVFNICGNKYRLVVHVNYDHGVIYMRFLGTHKEYDAIDAQEV